MNGTHEGKGPGPKAVISYPRIIYTGTGFARGMAWVEDDGFWFEIEVVAAPAGGEAGRGCGKRIARLRLYEGYRPYRLLGEFSRGWVRKPGGRNMRIAWNAICAEFRPRPATAAEEPGGTVGE